MYERVEKEYFTAKRKAAARMGVGFRYSPQDLPSNREIRDEILSLARMFEGQARLDTLGDMRVTALRMMRILEPFSPRLIGSTLTGHIRKGSDIDIHVFSNEVSAVTDVLDTHAHEYHVEHKRVIKHNVERVFTHVHFAGHYPIELTVYGRDLLHYSFKSSITGKAIEKVGLAELEALIAREHGEAPPAEADGCEPRVDRFLIWPLMLTPLEEVRQDPRYHPEGDALYHSLQAFELARQEMPFDQELITAALLHDVGKAIDRSDHVAAGLEALEGTLTDREAFLIAHHMDVQADSKGGAAGKVRRKLAESEWFDDLLTLRDIDQRARRPGVRVCTVEEAIAFLQAMDAEGESF